MIVVMGAAGNTGSKIATRLIDAGHQVRVLGRSTASLTGLASRGADVRRGVAEDSYYLADAFAGATAVYVLLPTDAGAADYLEAQRAQGEAVVEALARSDVPRVVALSSLGADSDGDHGLIRGLHAQEQRLRSLRDRALVLLRPASFFENFRQSLPLIRSEGIVADSVLPDLPIPMVATADVADAAVGALSAPDVRPGIVLKELLGPRDVTFAEATRIIGAAIGRPDLPYVQLGYDQCRDALVAAGLGSSFATLYVEMTRAFNQRQLGPVAGRTALNTTQTTFEAFAPSLAAQFRGQHDEA